MYVTEQQTPSERAGVSQPLVYVERGVEFKCNNPHHWDRFMKTAFSLSLAWSKRKALDFHMKGLGLSARSHICPRSF
jgi:hypothetical protein